MLEFQVNIPKLFYNSRLHPAKLSLRRLGVCKDYPVIIAECVRTRGSRAKRMEFGEYTKTTQISYIQSI